MKKLIIASFVLLFLTGSAFAQVGFEGKPIINNIWSPTGYTLQKEEFLVGIGPIGFGLNDNVQIGTNILLFLFQVYNANLKTNLMKSETMAFSAGIDYARIRLERLLDLEDDDINVISPYVAFSKNVGSSTMLHVAGIFSIFDEDSDDYEAEFFASGTEILGGIEYSVSHKTKMLVDCGYDFTFEGLKVGGAVLFGREELRLKLGVSYYAPETAGEDFTLPVIELYWRFKG